MNKILNLLLSMVLFFGLAHISLAQSYISFFKGDRKDVTTNPKGACVLMGGASENDNAMKWFLNHSDGGDVVVLSTSGNDDYNAHMYSELGMKINSVETIVFKSVLASHDAYVINQIRNAEALWIAGEDQWSFYAFWKGTPIDTAINYLINDRQVPVGGNSAGMSIMGSIINTAQNGGVTSEGALGDPYNDYVTISNTPFIIEPHLKNIITDTHYDNPDRKGRHIAFMARAFNDYGVAAKGIACDEYTAICIDEDGIAHVFGDYPSKEDYAYFIQANCSMPNEPETCKQGQALTWDRGQQALKVYKIAGTNSGQFTFDLNDWLTGFGGSWQNWYVVNGKLSVNTQGSQPNCSPLAAASPLLDTHLLSIYPNPVMDEVTIAIESKITGQWMTITNAIGKVVYQIKSPGELTRINVSDWNKGIYFVKVGHASNSLAAKFVKE